MLYDPDRHRPHTTFESACESQLRPELRAKLEKNLDRDVQNILWLEGDVSETIDRILGR